MSNGQLDRLKNAQGKLGLAMALGVPLRQLTRAVYGIPIPNRYTVFEIRKSSGGSRIIHVPHREIKFVQKSLAQLLQSCLSEIETRNGVKHPVSHGFHPKRSIFSNAWPHRNKNYVMNLDLEDFFHSIHFGRVYGYFEKNNDFLLNPKVANLIANISCHRNDVGGTFLPQGSPCSPVISNLIARPLDSKLRIFAKENKCRYTRYADDITFSTNLDNFPESIALLDSVKKYWVVGSGTTKIITKSGFRLNLGKTRMSVAGTRQMVTGLVVNRQVSVNKTTYKWARAASDRLFKEGVAFKRDPSTASIHTTDRQVTIAQLIGQVNHICHARRKSNIPLLHSRDMVGPELLYRRLTYYDRFFSNKNTLIICEGETDNIYLKIALKKFGANFKNLYNHVDDKATVQLLNITTHVTSYTALNGGSDQQKSFLQNFDNDMRIVKDRWADKPVILLGDNDSGANAIMQILRGKSIIAGDIKTAQFTHYIKNLYVIFTPVTSKTDNSMIEDFLDPKASKAILGGKSFHLGGKGFDEKKHYGKKALAEHVKENADKYDFSSFNSILKRLDLAVGDYAERLARSMA
ncbi:retron Ec67 family RNA-directed DNA polymerase/endonuclease [Methylobacterium sp. J-090]|uniref:retron Ec67 family RNA-directed DNA polymerase/endonuclease n=1 Tax=Methylobacterium sp. J-090 TaxID=2836666 RepID=UPI001FB87DEE|nr:retron Ec67 family RNA-directed DNA polymerase/endonuclease [Methylobacterium sp. J-090]MCJ2083496.1 retron Ec67 family RNA-directed DNA polymerase/endonuclease [Methylobacterium sp. J-090]